MKTNTPKMLITVMLLTVLSFAMRASTNVSGGIFANTTWTLANSPYIVTDTVVVFPGVTLTIQPGVTVAFADNKRIEFRQARLIAEGSNISSITFTSSSLTPVAGIYPGIYLNGGTMTSRVRYCNFQYATNGINATLSDSLIVSNSYFTQNINGVQFIGTNVAEVCLVDSCIFNTNTNGLVIRTLHSSAINHCNFTSNSTDGLVIDDADHNMVMTINHCSFTYNSDAGLLWHMHYMNINHCSFLNNTTGFGSFGYLSSLDSYNMTTKNSIFNNNQTGISTVAYMLLDSCKINHNQTGSTCQTRTRIRNCTIDSNSVLGISMNNDSIGNSSVKYNGAGIQVSTNSIIAGNTIDYNTGDNITCGTGTITITENIISHGTIGIDNNTAETLTITKNTIQNNGIGIYLVSPGSTINCNTICNNTTYDLKYLASTNIYASNNYWCTTDSVSTGAMIYDGHNNINYGLVNFMPFDTAQCFIITTGISVNEAQDFQFSIYPNPVTDNLTVTLPAVSGKAKIEIHNMLGELVYSSSVSSAKTNIDVSSMATGIYVIQLTKGVNIERQKIIRQ